MDAVSFYIDCLKKTKEKITVITVAPMTNLGLALSAVPSIAENIEELIIMGGTDRLGNVSECAEAKIYGTIRKRLRSPLIPEYRSPS